MRTPSYASPKGVPQYAKSRESLLFSPRPFKLAG
jgi:hypothetical protein